MIHKTFFIMLFADFLTGVGHWIQDRYFNITTPIIGSVIRDNIAHHKEPWRFLNTSYFDRNNTMIFLCLLGLILVITSDLLSFYSFFFLLYLSQTNEIHAMSHNPKPPVFFKYLQSFGLVQSYSHHKKHHLSPYDVNYCILTNLLNPFLDMIGFWQKLEYLLLKINIKTRN